MRGLLDLEAGTDFYSIAAADSAFIAEVAEDASPTLGGSLDAGGFDITNVNDLTVGNDVLCPNSGTILNFGAGDVTITYTSNALTVAGGNFFIVDEAYDAGTWNGNLSIPTKNAVRDYLETLTGTTLPAAYQPLDADLTTWAGVTPSANGQSLVSAANYAAMRTLLDLEAGTDFYSIAAADSAFLSQAEGDAAYQPLDADLTAIAALTTTAAGRSTLAIADAGVDRVVAWDDSAGAMAAIALADLTDEGSPAAGDYILLYGAEGDLRKSNWNTLPGGGGAASDTASGVIELAIQSEMEAGTDVVRAVVPGRQQFHDSACKFWVYWTGNSTTILRDYNVDSVANTAAGDADVTITTDFSDANWAGFVTTNDSTATGWDADSIQSCGFNARAAGTFGVLCGLMIDGGTAVGNTTHPQQWNAMGFGDHA
jgi:hypothetical protein